MLNPAEKVLLSMSLADPQQRLAIAAQMESEAGSQGKVSPYERDRLFQVCIGLSGQASGSGGGGGGGYGGPDAACFANMVCAFEGGEGGGGCACEVCHGRSLHPRSQPLMRCSDSVVYPQ